MSARITMKTARELRFCTRGMRQFCQETGLDYGEMMRRMARGGIPVEEVEHMDDARVAQLVAKAKEQAGG